MLFNVHLWKSFIVSVRLIQELPTEQLKESKAFLKFTLAGKSTK